MHETKTPSKYFWIILAVFYLFLLCTFMYSDFVITAKNAYYGMKTFIPPRTIRDFYDFSISFMSYTTMMADYEFPMYLIFMIWELPLRLIQALSGIMVMETIWGLLYANLIIPVFCLLTWLVMNSIARELGISKDARKWLLLFCLTSLNGFAAPSMMMKQYDLIPLLFMLLGFRSLLNKDTKWFLIWFSFANTLKMFSILIFIPLLLFSEKRVIQLGLKAAAGFVVTLIFKLIYWGDAAYQIGPELFSDGMVNSMFLDMSINSRMAKIMLFFVVYCSICYIAYIWNEGDKRRFGYKAAWLCLASLLSFYMFNFIHVYWLQYALPFLALIIFMNPADMKSNMLLNCVGGIAFFMAASEYFELIYGGKGMLDLLWMGKAFPLSNRLFTTLEELWQMLDITRYMPAFWSVFFTACILILVKNYPRTTLLAQDSAALKFEPGIYLFRALTPIFFAGLIIYGYVTEGPKPKITILNTIDENVYNAAGNNLFFSDKKASQEMLFTESFTLDCVKIAFDSSLIDIYRNHSAFYLNIIDAQNGELLVSTEPQLLYNGRQTVEFDTRDVPLQAGRTYTFEIRGKWQADTETRLLYTAQEDRYPSREDEAVIDYDWQMQLIANG